MTGKFTNAMQAALIFEDGRPVLPRAVVGGFLVEMRSRQLPMSIVQDSPTVAVLKGVGDLHITISFHHRPCDPLALQSALASPVTRLLCPDVNERVLRHSSYLLIELQHGVFDSAVDDEKVAALFDKVGMPKQGHSLGEFNMRIDVLAELCRQIMAIKPASLVHWTQSNSLLPGDRADAFLTQTEPGLLTIHPILFGDKPWPGFTETPAGIFTRGAADYVGREIYVPAVPIPWLDLYQFVLPFVRVAIARNGYVVPSGDTFGDEDKTVAFEVTHLEADRCRLNSGRPTYELKLLYSRKHSFTTIEHETRSLVPGGMRQATKEMEPTATPGQHRQMINDWDERARTANAMGNSIELYRKGYSNGSDPNRPYGGPLPQKAVFGKRH